ncbi:MAG: hypothetical protein KKF41_01615 [Actinobacteria bacterium]|nr:hypothetical protein [Actinomycetota bacterium]MBU1942391.1 hypothetical protein [Actinomycetota bacterium]MBU2686263.1 hypothetical protein [Actinomycetota bacterium]
MECTSCGAEVDEQKFFCPECKEPLKDEGDILPARGEGEPPGAGRAAAPYEPAAVEETPAETAKTAPWSIASHRLFSRSLLLRIAITVAILLVLILGLVLMASLKNRSDEKTPRLPLQPEELSRRVPSYRSSVKARTATTTAKIITP